MTPSARLAAIVLLVLASGLYLHLQRVRALDAEIAELERQNASLARQGVSAGEQRDELKARLASGRLDPTAPPQAMPPALLAGPFGAKIDRMLDYLVEHPERSIPELAHLQDQDWVKVAGDYLLDSDDNMRRALGKLRQAAKDRLAPRFGEAIKAYVAANNGMLPDDPTQLAPHLDPPVSDEILARYKMTITGPSANARRDGRSYSVLAERGVVDELYDSQMSAGLGQYGQSWGHGAATFEGMLSAAYEKWSQANPGMRAAGRQEIVPFLNPAIDQGKLRDWLAAPPSK